MSKWSIKVSPIVTTALVNLVVIGLSLAGLEAYFRHRQARNVGTRPTTLRLTLRAFAGTEV